VGKVKFEGRRRGVGGGKKVVVKKKKKKKTLMCGRVGKNPKEMRRLVWGDVDTKKSYVGPVKGGCVRGRRTGVSNTIGRRGGETNRG